MKRRSGSWRVFFTPLEGREVCILLHPDPGLRGVRGRVLLEKRRCLLVEEAAGGRRLCVLKSGGLFLFKLEGLGWVLVRGEELQGLLWERLRRLEKGKGVVWLVRAGEERRYTGCEAPGEDV